MLSLWRLPPAALDDGHHVLDPLRQRVRDFRFIAIPIVDRDDTGFDVVDREFGDVRRHAKASQTGPHRAA